MARIAGKAGKVWVKALTDVSFGANQYMLGVTSWSLDDTANVLETTGMDSAGAATHIGGVTRFSGSITAFWDSDDTYVLPPDLVPGTHVDVQLDGVAGNQPRYSGEVVVESSNPEVSVDGVVTYTIAVTGTGALTRPT